MTHWAPTPQPQPSQSMRRRPKFWLAIGLTALLTSSCGLIAGMPADSARTDDAKTPSKARPTATVTATVTAKPKKPAPRPTVTKTVRATATVTQKAAAPGSAADEPGTSVYYSNCSEARAAGAAPVRRGQPGYGSHLDRDGDGVGCDS
jgi:hypothetical protein